MEFSRGIDSNITYRKRRSLIIKLLAYFKPYMPLLMLSILFAVLINVSVIVKPYIIKYIIDDYLAVGINAPDVFLYVGLIYFGVVLIGAGLSYSQTYILTYIGQKIMYDIRNQLFTHIQNMSIKFLTGLHPAGSLHGLQTMSKP